MSLPRFFLLSSLILTGLLSRLLPHLPNFTALNAIALFGAYSLGTTKWSSSFGAFGLVTFILFLSDCILGFHSTCSFVYFSFGLSVFLGQTLKEKLKPELKIFEIFKTSLISSLLFFFITNLGVFWLDGLYPITVEGLGFCYLAALPFLGNQLFGDLIYTTLFFSAYQFWKGKSEILSSELIEN